MSNGRSEPVIHVAGRDWPVRLVNSPRARRYRLAMDPVHEALRLTVPRGATSARALAWAASQQNWIAAAAARMTPPVAVTIGSIIPLEGEAHRIAWAADAPRAVVRRDAMLLTGGPADAAVGRVGRWMKAEALRVLDAESHHYAAMIDRTPARVGVADPRSRWGSCAHDGTLRYNWRLIMAPPFVRRATVAHEVAHLVHMNHGADFHALVDRLFEGDVGSARNWLKANGSGLHRWRF